jgi:hypothetical protein
MGRYLLRFSQKPRHAETVAKIGVTLDPFTVSPIPNPQSKFTSLLTRSLSNPAVLYRLEEQLYTSKSSIHKLLPDSSRHDILNAIERQRNALVKRDGEKSLTAVIIQAIGETDNAFAVLILALLIFPIAVGEFLNVLICQFLI